MSIESFKYQLEASAQQQYEGGTSRTVTRQNISSLKDMAIYSLRIDPGCLRELHWHPNAGELSYCLQGQGTMGIFSPAGDHATFEIVAGSVSFVPKGYFHYIASTSDEPMHFLVFFSNLEPNHIDLSESFGWFDHGVIAASFGVDPQVFADLPKRGDVFMAAKKKFAGV